MTQPSTEPKKPLELPEPNYPMVNRVLAENPFPPSGGSVELLWFEVGKPHPLSSEQSVVRMFFQTGENGVPFGIEIYCAVQGGKVGGRSTIPWSLVKLVEEVMPAEIFVEQITDAENAGAEGGEHPRTNGASPS